jgi:fatty-acid desaturase
VNDFQNNLDFIAGLFGLDGIKIAIKDMKKKTLGRWCPFTNRIFIKRELGQHWSLLVTALIHEIGHSKQRRLWSVFIAAFILIGIGGMWFYIAFMPSNSGIQYNLFRILYLIVFSVIGVGIGVYVHKYTEDNAYEYENKFTPSIIYTLSLIEGLEILQSMENKEKSIQKYLSRLYYLIQKELPYLFQI